MILTGSTLGVGVGGGVWGEEADLIMNTAPVMIMIGMSRAKAMIMTFFLDIYLTIKQVKNTSRGLKKQPFACRQEDGSSVRMKLCQVYVFMALAER